MGLEGLKAVLAKFQENPKTANGFHSGGYSVDFDKIWRGNAVIGYANEKAVGHPELPAFLPTSRTSNQEADLFNLTQEIAPPEPALAPMEIKSPQGEESEEEAPPEGGPGPELGMSPEEMNAPPGEEETGGPPEGEAGSLAELGPEFEKNLEQAKELEKAVPPPESFKARAKAGEPLGLAKESGPERSDLEVLSEARLEETRRKYYRASAALEFDVEAKEVTGGEKVTVYLLPVVRPEGKYEIYDHTVTKYTSIPSSYAVQQAVFSAVAEAIPHVTVNRTQLLHIARRAHSAMKAAKDDMGGINDEDETVTEAIERYFADEPLMESSRPKTESYASEIEKWSDQQLVQKLKEYDNIWGDDWERLELFAKIGGEGWLNPEEDHKAQVWFENPDAEDWDSAQQNIVDTFQERRWNAAEIRAVLFEAAYRGLITKWWDKTAQSKRRRAKELWRQRPKEESVSDAIDHFLGEEEISQHDKSEMINENGEKKVWDIRTRKSPTAKHGRGYYWEIVRILDGRELTTPMRYFRKSMALAKLAELNKEA